MPKPGGSQTIIHRRSKEDEKHLFQTKGPVGASPSGPFLNDLSIA